MTIIRVTIPYAFSPGSMAILNRPKYWTNADRNSDNQVGHHKQINENKNYSQLSALSCSRDPRHYGNGIERRVPDQARTTSTGLDIRSTNNLSATRNPC